MNSDQLIRFKTIAESRTLTDAAQSLFISQSALSHSLSALEKELGCALFDRKNSKTLTLTPEGETLLKYANAVEDLLIQAHKAVIQSDVINISAINICSAFILTNYPKDKLDKIHLLFAKEADLPELLFKGNLDVAICDDFAFNMYYSSQNKLTSFLPHKTIVCRETLALLVPETHPFYNKSSLPYVEIGDTPLVMQSNATSLMEWMENVKKVAGFQFNVIFSIDNYSFNLIRDDLSYPQLIILNSVYNPMKRLRNAKIKYKVVPITGIYSSRFIYLWYLDQNVKKVQPILNSLKKYYLDYDADKLERRELFYDDNDNQII